MPEFLLGVAQTAIGSGLAFLLGIGAFHYQQHLQSESQSKKDWRAALDALNRLNMAAGANIEALANAKLQFIYALHPEVKMMKDSSQKIYEMPIPERADDLQSLKTLSETLQHFYMSFPRTSIMPPPVVVEYSSLGKEMPMLSLFVHRAMGMMQELNERIMSRNALIAEHAREGGKGEGMNGERLMYFSRMLADEGAAICIHTDDALDFWRLVSDQVKAYMTHKAKGEQFIEYELVPKALDALPKDELFPLMREQLVTFEN
jgi:hypothetical protein